MNTRSSAASIVVRFKSPGFHAWPEAPASVAYLRERHRHLFHVSVAMNVFHDDREVEFHTLLAKAQGLFPTGDLGSRSCEMLARELGWQLATFYDRAVRVSVFEDGENGSQVEVQP